MQTIRVRSQVGLDGILQLQIPIGRGNITVEVLLLIQSLPTPSLLPESLESPRHFDERVGSILAAEFSRCEGCDRLGWG
jgi:hypothetical protein